MRYLVTIWRLSSLSDYFTWIIHVANDVDIDDSFSTVLLYMSLSYPPNHDKRQYSSISDMKVLGK